MENVVDRENISNSGIAQHSDPNVLRGERPVRPVAVQVVTGGTVGSETRHHQVVESVSSSAEVGLGSHQGLDSVGSSSVVGLGNHQGLDSVGSSSVVGLGNHQVLDSVGSSSEVGLGRTEIVACLGQENVGIGIENQTNNGNKSRLKVTIKSWNGIAVWKWLAKDDICGICRNSFHGCCTDCKFAGDDCPLVWGECTHCFHLHCIMKWLQSQQQCPMCRKEWKYLNS